MGAADPAGAKLASRFLAGSRLIAAMCLCEILCMAGFATYPALLPRLSTEWGLTNAAAGFIGGILFFAYAIGVPFLTGLTDRVDSRRVYIASCLVAGNHGPDRELERLLARANRGVGTKPILEINLHHPLVAAIPRAGACSAPPRLTNARLRMHASSSRLPTTS